MARMIIEAAHDRAVQPPLVDAQDRFGQVPLTTAISTNKMAAAKLLCESGANPHLKGIGTTKGSGLVARGNGSVSKASNLHVVQHMFRFDYRYYIDNAHMQTVKGCVLMKCAEGLQNSSSC